MSLSLAHRAPVPAPADYIGASTASLYAGEIQVTSTPALETDPAAATGALGTALQALSLTDAAAVLEALSEQTAALSLILAADAAGAINLPESLRAIARSASVLPAFLSGAN